MSRNLEEPYPSQNMPEDLSEYNPDGGDEKTRVLQRGPQPESQCRDEVRDSYGFFEVQSL